MLNKENGFSLPFFRQFPRAKKYAFTFVTLFILLLAVYSNSFYGEWHFDDYANIVENPYIRISSFAWPEIKQVFNDTYQYLLLRPLSYLSFALNYRLGGMDVFGFHVFNLFIHFLSSVFLFLFIFNTLHLPLLREKYAPIAYPVALVATFFWAAHPVWVTSVSYIVQRMTSMAALFYILSMYFYLKARTSSNKWQSLGFFLFCALSATASFLSKENAAMLPFSLLLFDLLLISGVTKEHLKKTGKILILPVLLILVIGFLYTGGFTRLLHGYDIRDFSLTQRLLTEPRILLFYISLLIYPISSRLTLLYDIDISTSLFSPWTTAASILVILLMVGLAVHLARRRPLISFCILFFFVNHLIESSFIPLELIYEHRNYLPAMLLFVPVAEFIIFIIDYFSYKTSIQFIVALEIAVILFGLGDVTYRRNAILSDDALLWLDNIEKSPSLSRPHTNLGRIYANLGNKDQAFSEYQKAMALDKFANKRIRAVQESNLGMYYFDHKQNDLAWDYFQKSSVYLTDYKNNTLFMARIKIRQHQLPASRKILEDKLAIHPHDPDTLELCSFVLLKEGKLSDAEQMARKALAKSPAMISANIIMAEICRRNNNDPCSIHYWKKVRTIMPDNAYANLALLELYAKLKDEANIREELLLLINLKGNYPLETYIQALSEDPTLLAYVPEIKHFSFLTRACPILN